MYIRMKEIMNIKILFDFTVYLLLNNKPNNGFFKSFILGIIDK